MARAGHGGSVLLLDEEHIIAPDEHLLELLDLGLLGHFPSIGQQHIHIAIETGHGADKERMVVIQLDLHFTAQHLLQEIARVVPSIFLHSPPLIIYCKSSIYHMGWAYHSDVDYSVDLGSPLWQSVKALVICQIWAQRMQWWVTSRFESYRLGLIKALMPLSSRNAFNSVGLTLGSVILKKIILVSTFSTISTQPSLSSFLLSFLAASLSSPSQCLMVFKAMIPISARMPGFLSMPPIIFLFLLNLVMNSRLPTTTDPMGVHSPLLRQNITESHYFTSSFGSIFSQAQALKIRAPSIWMCMPYDFAIWISQLNCYIGQIRPQEVGFSMANIVLLGACESLIFRIQLFSPLTGMNMLLSHSMVLVSIREIFPTLPFSQDIIWALSPKIISVPGLPAVKIEHWLPKVPVGTKLAASLPRISAAIISSLMTVKSSPQVWSPYSAVVMQARISVVSSVTVSDRKSICFITTIIKGRRKLEWISFSNLLAIHVEIADCRGHVVIPRARVVVGLREPVRLGDCHSSRLVGKQSVIADSCNILGYKVGAMGFADQIARHLPLILLEFGPHALLDVVPASSWVLVEMVHGFRFRNCVTGGIEFLVLVMAWPWIMNQLIMVYP